MDPCSPSLLDKIVAAKRLEVEQAKSSRPLAELRAAARDAPSPRDFFAALAAGGPIKLIAEVKKASPSLGVIRQDFQPVAIAEAYARGGATCLSVLTDAPFFQGSLDDLRHVRAAVTLPILRKDFILEEYQLWEARQAGADAILLIAECLDDCQLRSLHHQALDLGLTPLVEFHHPDQCARIVELGATLIGVNNRDLRTFQTDVQHTLRMRRQIPDACVVVAESGIRAREEGGLLQACGVDAILVGERLLVEPDVERAVRNLLGN